MLEDDGFRIEPAGDTTPDVTFRANTSAYVLLVYGRLDISSGSTPVQLEIHGPLETAPPLHPKLPGVLGRLENPFPPGGGRSEWG